VLPEWYIEEPKLSQFEEIYLSSFWKLNTERFYEGGPIPYSLIEACGIKLSLDDTMLLVFCYIIQAIDAHYLNLAKSKN
jgi:hypothetical protein